MATKVHGKRTGYILLYVGFIFAFILLPKNLGALVEDLVIAGWLLFLPVVLFWVVKKPGR